MEHDRLLTRDRWLDEALKVLKAEGHQALRAEPLAKRLQVSRGSFYWHFADVAAFHRAILARWSVLAVEEPLAQAGRDGEGEEASLDSLIDVAFRAPRELERAVHGWAAVNPHAAEAVAAVNRRRVLILAGMFKRQGLTPPDAEASAVVLYWTFLGRVLCAEFPSDDRILAQVHARFGGTQTGPAPARRSGS